MSVARPRRSSDPDRVRLWVGAVLLVVTALALVAIIFAALQIHSGVRAYVGGEGLYVAFLVKPFMPAALVQGVRQALEGGAGAK